VFGRPQTFCQGPSRTPLRRGIQAVVGVLVGAQDYHGRARDFRPSVSNRGKRPSRQRLAGYQCLDRVQQGAGSERAGGAPYQLNRGRAFCGPRASTFHIVGFVSSIETRRSARRHGVRRTSLDEKLRHDAMARSTMSCPCVGIRLGYGGSSRMGLTATRHRRSMHTRIAAMGASVDRHRAYMPTGYVPRPPTQESSGSRPITGGAGT